jgi:hypothetical protein
LGTSFLAHTSGKAGHIEASTVSSSVIRLKALDLGSPGPTVGIVGTIISCQGEPTIGRIT